MRIYAAFFGILLAVLIGCSSGADISVTGPDHSPGPKASPTAQLVYACSSSWRGGQYNEWCDWFDECNEAQGCYNCDTDPIACQGIQIPDDGSGSGSSGGGSTGGGGLVGSGGYAYYDNAYLPDELCQPRYDPRCKIRAPLSWEVDALRADLERIKNRNFYCSEIHRVGTFYLNGNIVGFFAGPSQNATGDDSVGDNHDGVIHVSTRGFWNGTEYPINTMAQKATIFRHEVKHRLGWTHAQMQLPERSCD